MIIDLEAKEGQDKFITEKVSTLELTEEGYWKISFHGSSKSYDYNSARLIYMTEPEVVNLEGRGMYIKDNKCITDVAQLLRFTDDLGVFYRATYQSGRVEHLEGADVYVPYTRMDDIDGTVWGYLNKLAQETGLRAPDGKSLLEMQYEMVGKLRSDVPLVQYLGDKTKLAQHKLPRQVYYPFGCNASQKQAVERALTHQLSVIQGPPGTGKTQTILNIIANLVLEGKSVLVVSNNNSAVLAVSEKLEREGLGFLVARLGSAERKSTFFRDQILQVDNLTAWLQSNPDEVKINAGIALDKVSQGFADQIALAELHAELEALRIEQRHKDPKPRSLAEPYIWLEGISSVQIVDLLLRTRLVLEQGKGFSLWRRLLGGLRWGWQAFATLGKNLEELMLVLENLFYQVRLKEVEAEIEQVSKRLKSLNLTESLADLSQYSLLHLKHRVAERYSSQKRTFYRSAQEIKADTERFLEQYPIVLSTTHSAKGCINPNYVFDYVIMDEASQVDIKTGALALSCALNAVIVGDDKQLPNVVTAEDRQRLTIIQELYGVDKVYHATEHSFLTSCLARLPHAPNTLLREHYRCHPKIIGFCNQRFYDGELITMTKDGGEAGVLQVLCTAPGNHARERVNQREIDVIVHELMPRLQGSGSVGIITPYADQAKAINQALGVEIASTVHRYQGRECDTIIISTVKNSPTVFSDKDDLINVAVSRAKSRLCIVTTGNDLPVGSNLGQLIAYVRYHNGEVQHSALRSVFDLLYSQYTHQRIAYSRARGLKKSDQLSEHLVYETLTKAIMQVGLGRIAVLCYYPLASLIQDWSLLSKQEESFARNPMAHVDFLLYNTLTKRPLMVIEVDGWSYHQGSRTQQARDKLKDSILHKYGLKPQRLNTTHLVTTQTLAEMISRALSADFNPSAEALAQSPDEGGR